MIDFLLLSSSSMFISIPLCNMYTYESKFLHPDSSSHVPFSKWK